jgi:hypothetical protein
MNGGAWGIRNRGGGAYNQDVQDHVERMHEEVEEQLEVEVKISKVIDEFILKIEKQMSEYIGLSVGKGWVSFTLRNVAQEIKNNHFKIE